MGSLVRSDEWISGLRARKALGIGYGALQRLAVIGRIRTLIEPGSAPKYSAADVARLAGVAGQHSPA